MLRGGVSSTVFLLLLSTSCLNNALAVDINDDLATPSSIQKNNVKRNTLKLAVPNLDEEELNYQFLYRAWEKLNHEGRYGVQQDEKHRFHHREERVDGITKGQYRFELPNGRVQVVSYKQMGDEYLAKVNYLNSDQHENSCLGLGDDCTHTNGNFDIENFDVDLDYTENEGLYGTPIHSSQMRTPDDKYSTKSEENSTQLVLPEIYEPIPLTTTTPRYDGSEITVYHPEVFFNPTTPLPPQSLYKNLDRDRGVIYGINNQVVVPYDNADSFRNYATVSSNGKENSSSYVKYDEEPHKEKESKKAYFEPIAEVVTGEPVTSSVPIQGHPEYFIPSNKDQISTTHSHQRKTNYLPSSASSLQPSPTIYNDHTKPGFGYELTEQDSPTTYKPPYIPIFIKRPNNPVDPVYLKLPPVERPSNAIERNKGKLEDFDFVPNSEISSYTNPTGKVYGPITPPPAYNTRNGNFGFPTANQQFNIGLSYASPQIQNFKSVRFQSQASNLPTFPRQYNLNSKPPTHGKQRQNPSSLASLKFNSDPSSTVKPIRKIPGYVPPTSKPQNQGRNPKNLHVYKSIYIDSNNEGASTSQNVPPVTHSSPEMAHQNRNINSQRNLPFIGTIYQTTAGGESNLPNVIYSINGHIDEFLPSTPVYNKRERSLPNIVNSDLSTILSNSEIPSTFRNQLRELIEETQEIEKTESSLKVFPEFSHHLRSSPQYPLTSKYKSSMIRFPDASHQIPNSKRDSSFKPSTLLSLSSIDDYRSILQDSHHPFRKRRYSCPHCLTKSKSTGNIPVFNPSQSSPTSKHFSNSHGLSTKGFTSQVNDDIQEILPFVFPFYGEIRMPYHPLYETINKSDFDLSKHL